MSEYDRLVSDVCVIFKEVTGAEAIPTREAVAIVNFARKHQWASYEFRLLIEHQYRDDAARSFFVSNPGRMNLRSFFNPLREEILLDILADLKRAKEIQKKQSDAIDAGGISPDVKILQIICKCGQKLNAKRFIKIQRSNPQKGETLWYWKGEIHEDFEPHYNQALTEGWTCMWPRERVTK